MGLTRRQVLRGGLAAGGLLVARPTGVGAATLGPRDAYGTARFSPLHPGTSLVHADLHNHTLFSDGDGDPEAAFASLRDAGLDVAALTDHAAMGDGLPSSPCEPLRPFGEDRRHECQSGVGIDEGSWAATAALAAAATTDDFLAIRGFEWSSPSLGHLNVWFSREFTDPLHTAGIGTPNDLLREGAGEGFPVPAEVVASLDAVVRGTPAAGAGMAGWYAWLAADPETPVIGGGADGLFGFNHPGREAGRFGDFAFEAALVDRCVSMELFNRREDYLFERTDDLGMQSPLVACLDAGWRPGLLGVTDEHGDDWGFPDGKGRAGLYVRDLSETGVREALLARRFYATNLKGLRLGATANGVPMGGTLGHRTGAVTLAVDVDRGPAWTGRTLRAQVLATGSVLPTVLADVPIRVPAAGDPLPTLTVDHDVTDGRWLVLRLTDPEVAPDPRADATYAAMGGAIAYASPFHLDPDLPASVSAAGAVSAGPSAPPPSSLPSTGGGRVLAGLTAVGAAGLLSLRRRDPGAAPGRGLSDR